MELFLLLSNQVTMKIIHQIVWLSQVNVNQVLLKITTGLDFAIVQQYIRLVFLYSN